MIRNKRTLLLLAVTIIQANAAPLLIISQLQETTTAPCFSALSFSELTYPFPVAGYSEPFVPIDNLNERLSSDYFLEQAVESLSLQVDAEEYEDMPDELLWYSSNWRSWRKWLHYLARRFVVIINEYGEKELLDTASGLEPINLQNRLARMNSGEWGAGTKISQARYIDLNSIVIVELPETGGTTKTDSGGQATGEAGQSQAAPVTTAATTGKRKKKKPVLTIVVSPSDEEEPDLPETSFLQEPGTHNVGQFLAGKGGLKCSDGSEVIPRQLSLDESTVISCRLIKNAGHRITLIVELKTTRDETRTLVLKISREGHKAFSSLYGGHVDRITYEQAFQDAAALTQFRERIRGRHLGVRFPDTRIVLVSLREYMNLIDSLPDEDMVLLYQNAMYKKLQQALQDRTLGPYIFVLAQQYMNLRDLNADDSHRHRDVIAYMRDMLRDVGEMGENLSVDQDDGCLVAHDIERDQLNWDYHLLTPVGQDLPLERELLLDFEDLIYIDFIARTPFRGSREAGQGRLDSGLESLSPSSDIDGTPQHRRRRHNDSGLNDVFEEDDLADSDQDLK